MSLILDALKRAESERASVRQSTPLPTVAAAPALPQPRRTWMVGTVAVLAILALVLALTRREAPPSKVQPEASERAAAPVPTLENKIETATRSSIPQIITPIPGSEGVASLDDLTEPEVLNQSVAEPVPVAAADPEPTPAAPPAAEPVAPVPEPSSPVVTASAPKTLKPLRDMPSSYRAEFPALSILVHSYDANPAARFVRIGGHRYKEGEVLAEGPRLLEIVSKGLVLEYRGERVIYPLD